jgi:hypothetical protein
VEPLDTGRITSRHTDGTGLCTALCAVCLRTFIRIWKEPQMYRC